ncbi:MAG: hypothetical protein AABZ31_12080, partial [Bdellovibrionota bacterium]
SFSNSKDYSAFNLIGIDSVKIGICWWHSRLQRSLTYLALPRALKKGEKPMSSKEINLALASIINEAQVTELRGYKSIYEFSEKNKEAILNHLRYWQLTEVAQSVRGIVGHVEVSSHAMREKMDRLYDLVEVNKIIPFQMQQMEGPDAHSWIVIGATKAYKNKKWVGYDLLGVDSSASTQLEYFKYRFGDTQLKDSNNPSENFVPYTQRPQSELRYFTALAYYCQPQKTKAHLKAKFLLPLPTSGYIGDSVQPYAFDKSFLTPKTWKAFLK